MQNIKSTKVTMPPVMQVYHPLILLSQKCVNPLKSQVGSSPGSSVNGLVFYSDSSSTGSTESVSEDDKVAIRNKVPSYR